jgi:hypothetical protein
MIEEFTNSRTGIIILSIIWGLGLATLFKRSCSDPGCKVIEYKGPPLADTKVTWKFGSDKCYKIQPTPSEC